MNYAQHDLTDTIVALSTPPGEGAIGIVRLSGPTAVKIVDELFFEKDLKTQKSHTVHFGTIRDGGQILDEVLVSLFIAPTSYTGDDVVEVSCHGSSYILQQLIQLFIKNGARLAQPGEFTLRAFLNGKMDLSQAEAVADLIASGSESAHAVAMKQMRGGFSDKIKALREELIHFASLIELELDFGEEDVDFANRDDLKALVLKIQKIIHRLLDSFKLGNVIKNGVSTVIAGRPNAGKSTLLNAILNEERAIVSDIAGTTRDTIEEVLNIKGIEFRLIDTAGIREAHDQIEAIGVEKTFEKIRQSAIVIYLFELNILSPEEVKMDLENLREDGVPLLVVANKSDQVDEGRLGDFTTIIDDKIVGISAKHGINIEMLKEEIYQLALQGRTRTEDTIVTNSRHFDALQKAAEYLDQVLTGLNDGITGDFLAMDIRAALSYLGQITGEVSADDLLGNIFGKFCIGK